MKIGVLALQGNFREHRQVFARLGADVVEVRLPGDLTGVDGLVIPGGESTTIGRLAREFKIESAVRGLYLTGQLNIWGTCAGAIWLAEKIKGRPGQAHLGVMDISVERNAYGRQADSFSVPLQVPGFADPFPAIFIRAPGIASVGPEVNVLASFKGKAVLAKQGACLASTFHPELAGDDRIHRLFLSEIERRKKPPSVIPSSRVLHD